MTIEDEPMVRNLWRKCSGIFISDADTPEGIQKLLCQAPNFSIVAENESKTIIGCVLGSYDTRRGYIHHLAVHPENRKKGLGRALTLEIEKRFHAAGINKIHLFIVSENSQVCDFYKKIGWETRPDIILMSKILRR